MLRAITVIAVVVGLCFLVWSYVVMTGGRDWIVAQMAPAEMPPAPVAAKKEEPKAEEPKPAEAKPEAEAEPKPEAEPAEIAGTEPEAATAPGGVDPAGNPLETAKVVEKGSLTNPYRNDFEAVAEEGHKKYMAAGCNGCHGGTGGGGMGPPLSNPVWVYGNDGDTLFRLIALGSDGLQEQGYSRKGSENVVGPMPPHGSIVKSNDDMWKIIGWIWSINPPKD